MKTLEIERIEYSKSDQDLVSGFKKRLDPLVQTSCSESFSEWKALSNWLTCLSILDNLAVECSVTTDSIHTQSYFGSEAAGMLIEPSCSVNNSREDPTTFLSSRQTVGGIDIIDNVSYRKKCLSSLRFSLLQNHSRDAFSSSRFHCDVTDTAHDDSCGRTPKGNKNLLLWRDAAEILEKRKSAFHEVDTKAGKLHPLVKEPGALCCKVAIGHLTRLMDQLEIKRLICSNTAFCAVANPLLLQESSFCAWAVICEPHSGTRSHMNVMGSHGWHVLLHGKKKWRVAHPLDKYLVTNEDDGTVADLWSPDVKKFPLARSARIFEIVQDVGEALFLPSDAVHSFIALEESFGIHINFVEDSCYPMFEYQTNLNLLMLSSLKFDNGYLQQFTIVDVVVSSPAELQKPKLVIRGTVWCNDTGALWTELGARVELATFHDCFESIGDYLLYSGKEPHYAVGLPQGFYLCEQDHRLVLHYEAPLKTYSIIQDALEYLTTKDELDFRYFTVPHDGYQISHRFSSTISQEGSLLSFLPLSVVLNQPWSFEEKLVQTCIALPQVILEKAKHPQGFVRPGSVWHYSNKRYFSSVENRALLGSAADDDSSRKKRFESASIDKRSSALFYCSPLCRIPITLHPKKNRFTEKSTQYESFPNINEYAWNVEVLEKYGMVKLLQFREPVECVMRDVVCNDPQFESLQRFLVEHGLTPISAESLNSESIIASILWILCSPCVTGFTCPAGVQFDSGEFISSSDRYQFQMIGLPSRAASALLTKVKESPYGYILTELSNWVCDIYRHEEDRELIDALFGSIRCNCDVEVAEVLDQIRRVKESLMECSSDSNVNPQKLAVLSDFIRSLAEV